MMNLSLIEAATKIVVDYFESCNITESTKAIRAQVTGWYNYADITDAETLAALTIDGETTLSTKPTMDQIEALRDFYFPKDFMPPFYLNSISAQEEWEALQDERFY